jgi:hypothetical protein
MFRSLAFGFKESMYAFVGFHRKASLALWKTLIRETGAMNSPPFPEAVALPSPCSGHCINAAAPLPCAMGMQLPKCEIQCRTAKAPALNQGFHYRGWFIGYFISIILRVWLKFLVFRR